MQLSNTKIDQLGQRLNLGNHSEADLGLLDDFRRSFARVYEAVVEQIEQNTGLAATGRSAKTTVSIVDKIRREKTRLSRMQDIAGCRIVVGDIFEQDHAIDVLTGIFEKSKVVDRRDNPSNGYRAVHVIVAFNDRYVEVQVRTTLQHLWAELSEKYSDAVDRTIKYGGGPDEAREELLKAADLVSQLERRDVDGSYEAALSQFQAAGYGIADAPENELLRKKLVELHSVAKEVHELLVENRIRMRGLAEEWFRSRLAQLETRDVEDI